MEYNELILDMLNRIVKLEKEVEILKSKENTSEIVVPVNIDTEDKPQQRDKTRYMFNGNIYLKNRLVWAVIKEFIVQNPNITCGELKAAFNKSLQGSIGVVEYETIAKKRGDYRIRFFDKEDEILLLSDGNMLVCSQWGISNLPNFIKRAEHLGFEIEPVEK